METDRITNFLKGDPMRVCPTCNEFLTGRDHLRTDLDYCEACRRATHSDCVERIDGSPFCSNCADERRVELEVEATMDAIKAMLDAVRPRVERIKALGGTLPPDVAETVLHADFATAQYSGEMVTMAQAMEQACNTETPF